MDVSRLAATVAVLSVITFGSVSVRAETLSNPPYSDPGILSSIGFISVLLSTANLPVQIDETHAVQYTLKDGTKLGGLLFVDSSKGDRPLIIADFGLMSSRDSSLAGDVIEKLVNTGLLNANFLVLDDISGADFYAANSSLSVGGYDAGRILNELADELAAENVPFTTLSLMGESLGGLAVLEALMEDHRLGTGHFASAITFSGVTDEDRATATVMSAFGHTLSGFGGPALGPEGTLFLEDSLSNFKSSVASQNSSLALPGSGSAGDFFYNAVTQRLKSGITSNWNPAIDTSSVESYVLSSDYLLSQFAAVEAPVILVHAQNDPIVDYSEFESFAEAQQSNSRVLTLGTEDGSHCGFLGVYGANWVADLINRALSL